MYWLPWNQYRSYYLSAKVRDVTGAPFDTPYSNEPKKGDFFFSPRRSVVKALPFPLDALKDPEAFFEAVLYANTTSQEHGFLSILGLDISNRDHLYVASCVGEIHPSSPPFRIKDPEGEEIFASQIEPLFPVIKIKKALDLAKRRKGVVVGLRGTLFEDYKPALDPDSDYALKINVGEGLNVKHISFIMPLGREETAFFASLSCARINRNGRKDSEDTTKVFRGD